MYFKDTGFSTFHFVSSSVFKNFVQSSRKFENIYVRYKYNSKYKFKYKSQTYIYKYIFRQTAPSAITRPTVATGEHEIIFMAPFAGHSE